MSKLRTLIPETDYAAAALRICKLEKTLILCEILQSPVSYNSIEQDELFSLLEKSPGISPLNTSSLNEKWDKHELRLNHSNNADNNKEIRYLKIS